MARRRCSVAVLPPPALVDALQVLRRLLDDPRLDVLAPHVTLVAPVDLPAADVGSAAAAVRAGARAVEPFELTLGPLASFAPSTPTLHLSVGGDLGSLVALRDAVRRAPLDRPDRRPFVPHVTLRRSVEHAAVLQGAVAALLGEAGAWTVDRVVLLEHRPVNDELAAPDRRPGSDGLLGSDELTAPDGRRRWRPIAEEPLGAPVVVGRGGVELDLRTVTVVEPAVAHLLGTAPPADTFADRDRWVTVAERAPDGLVGALVGRVDGGWAGVDALAVAGAHRGVGIARHLVERWCTDAARRGARLAEADASVGADVVGVLASCGFSELRDRWVRLLRPGGTG